MTNAPPSLEQLLKNLGPCLSTVACRQLEKGGLSPAAARKRVSRIRGEIRRLTTLPFPKGAYFIFHDEDKNTAKYWTTLLRTAMSASPTYGPAISALIARGGVMPISHFAISCGAPIRQKGQIGTDLLLARLTNSGIVKEVDITGVGKCVALDGNGTLTTLNEPSLRSRLIVEKVLLLAIKSWARRLGLVSHDAVRSRDDYKGQDLPRVGPFAWDMTGPSYLLPLARRRKHGVKPGFFVCDVLCGQTVNDQSISAFIKKCTTLSKLRRIGPTLSFLVADHFSSTSFRLGRSLGIVVTTPDALFGKEIARALESLLGTLKHAAESIDHPERFEELFNSLSKIEGAAGNLRGALFELIVAHCVRLIEGGEVILNRIVIEPVSGKKAEIDVLLEKLHQSTLIIECRGQQPTTVVSIATVKSWVVEKVPTIYQALRGDPQFKQYSFRFEYWTCGTFDQDARAYLDKVALSTKAYQIAYKDGAGIKEYVAKLQGTSIRKTLDEHYFKHPVTKLINKSSTIKS